jgi:hypothetical protein
MGYDNAIFVNQLLVKYGHVDRSKAMIATGDYGHANEFGTPFYVFPAGAFNYTWFDSVDRDVNYDYHFKKTIEEYAKRDGILKTLKPITRSKATGQPIDMSKEVEKQKQWRDNAEEALKKYFITNKDFKYAIVEGKEIWFDCKEYYFISAGYGQPGPQEIKEELF